MAAISPIPTLFASRNNGGESFLSSRSAFVTEPHQLFSPRAGVYTDPVLAEQKFWSNIYAYQGPVQPDYYTATYLRATKINPGDARFEAGFRCDPNPPHKILDCQKLITETGEEVTRNPRPDIDQLLAVNDTRVDTIDLIRVPHLLYGPQGSLVKLTIKTSDTQEIFHLLVRRTVPASMWKIYDQANRTSPVLLNHVSEFKSELKAVMGYSRDIYTEQVAGGEGTTLGLVVVLDGEQFDTRVIVSSVIRGSPADLAGIRMGDAVVYVDGVAATPQNVASLISPPNVPIGLPVKLNMDRGGKAYTVQLAWSSATKVKWSQSLLQMIIDLRQAIFQSMPNGIDKESVFGMIKELFEYGVAMAKNRIDGEKNLCAKIRGMQISWMQEIDRIHSTLSAAPSAESTWAEIEHFTQWTASLHAKLTIAEEENKRLNSTVEQLKKTMSDMSIELGIYKEKIKVIEGMNSQMSAYSQEAMALKSQNAQLAAKIIYYEKELPKTVEAKRELEEHNQNILAEFQVMKGGVKAQDILKDHYDAEVHELKRHIERLSVEVITSRTELVPYRPAAEYCLEVGMDLYTCFGSIKETGLRPEEIVRLMQTLKQCPPPIVLNLEEMINFLRGPPRMNLAEVRDRVAQLLDLRTRADDASADATAAKGIAQREQRIRKDLEVEVVELKQLASLSQKALEAWKPMMDLMRTPPQVSPQEMAKAMQTSGSSAKEILMLLTTMGGPPKVMV